MEFWVKLKNPVLITALCVVFLSFALFANPVSGLKCPGKCISNTTVCKLKGGKIAGYCTNQKACCDFSYRKIGSCGSKMTNLTTAWFRSPDYPDHSNGDLICQFDFAFNSNSSGIIVEFSDVKMDGNGFIKNSACESDMIFFKGFPNWTPPAQCGNLTNYAALIDLGDHHTKGMTTLTLLAVMSSKKYRWNIKVTQLHHNPKKSMEYNSLAKIPSEEDYLDSEEEGEDDYEDDVRPTPKGPANKNASITQTMSLSSDNEESEQQEISRLIRIRKLINSRQSSQIIPSSSSIDNTYEQEGDENEQEDELEEEPLIVNGEDIKANDVPWQASLRTTISPRLVKILPSLGIKNCSITEGLHFCGGTIISHNKILAAVHCFSLGEKLSTWQRLSAMKVVLGDSNLCDERMDGVQEFSVDKVYYHYGYDNEVILNDMVVIKLKERIRFTDKIMSIKLANPGMNFETKEASVSGWGLTNLTSGKIKKSIPEQLQFAEGLYIGNRSYCSKEQIKLYPSMKRVQLIRYPKYVNIFNSLLCTYVRNGSIARVVGQGDSGGPLVLYPEKYDNMTDSSKKPILVGVISYMIPIPKIRRPHDVSDYVDFYQSVSFYRNWIDLAMHL